MATNPPLRSPRRSQHLLERLGPRRIEELLERHAADIAPRNGAALCCRGCGGRITETAERIERAGNHRHCCTNPHGQRFEIGCFAAAGGCACHGAPTSEFTWFPGYTWRIALCAACGRHLGWHYQGNVPSFFGLILDRLVPCNQ